MTEELAIVGRPTCPYTQQNRRNRERKRRRLEIGINYGLQNLELNVCKIQNKIL